jgi:acetyl esterase
MRGADGASLLRNMNEVMRRMTVTCYLLLLLCGSFSLHAQDVVELQPATVEGAVSRVYKSVDGAELRLHIFNPPRHDASALTPAIVLFFGGGWTGGTVRQFVPQSKHLSERGMIAIVAEYRVFSRHKTSAFEAITDGASAIRWVRAHATELGVDPNRIAAGGGSSGGHVALSTAVLDGFDDVNEDRRVSSRPNALVLFNPAVDTSLETASGARGRAGDTIKARFGGRGRDGSPFHHLRPGLVPTLILHGKDDTTIPYSDVERFCAQVRKHGDRCELIGYEGAGHGFFNAQRDDGKWYRETLLAADRFLTEIGYLRGR